MILISSKGDSGCDFNALVKASECVRILDRLLCYLHFGMLQVHVQFVNYRDELFGRNSQSELQHGGGSDDLGALSKTYEVRFDEVGNPYLTESEHQLMPSANECGCLFGSNAPVQRRG